MDEISCIAVNKSFASNFPSRTTKQVLTNLTFSVRKSELFGIIGANGAGKSTALKILMGFSQVDSGKAFIRNTSVSSSDCHTSLGYLPENPSLYTHLSPREHLFFGAKLYGLSKKNSSAQINELLKTVNLHKEADTPIKKFSKGMTQRAALAYALLPEPSVLILDEPMSGLDPLGRQMVIDIMLDYHNKGTTILFCSHILSDVERICDRIGIMNKGKLVTTITPTEVLTQYPPEKQRGSKTPLESFFLETIKNTDNEL